LLLLVVVIGGDIVVIFLVPVINYLDLLFSFELPIQNGRP
jgi:hypothetical protein